VLLSLCLRQDIVDESVLRMLGFSGGQATTNSRFGNVPGGDYGMDNVECQVRM
jgi:hypothetical protein